MLKHVHKVAARAASSNTSDAPESSWGDDGFEANSKDAGDLAVQPSDTFDSAFPYGGGGRNGSVRMMDTKNVAGPLEPAAGTTDGQSEISDTATDVQETASQIVSGYGVAPGLPGRRPAKRTASYSGLSPAKHAAAGNATPTASGLPRSPAAKMHSTAALPYGASMQKQGSLSSMGPGRSQTNDDVTTVGGAAASGMGLGSASQISGHSEAQGLPEIDGGSSSDDAHTQGTASPTRKAKKSK